MALAALVRGMVQTVFQGSRYGHDLPLGVSLKVQDRLEGIASDWPESPAAVALRELQQMAGVAFPQDSAELFAALLANGTGWMPAIFKTADMRAAPQEQDDAPEDVESMADEPVAGTATVTCAATVRRWAGQPAPTSPTFTSSRAAPGVQGQQPNQNAAEYPPGPANAPPRWTGRWRTRWHLLWQVV